MSRILGSSQKVRLRKSDKQVPQLQRANTRKKCMNEEPEDGEKGHIMPGHGKEDRNHISRQENVSGQV